MTNLDQIFQMAHNAVTGEQIAAAQKAMEDYGEPKSPEEEQMMADIAEMLHMADGPGEVGVVE